MTHGHPQERRRRHPSPRIFVAAGVLALVTLAACSSSTSKGQAKDRSPASTTTTSTTTPTAGGVDPNAPEAPVAGDIPDNQVFVPFSGTGYTVQVPEGWARTGSPDAVVFSDRYNTIRIDTGTSAIAPTVAGVTATDLPRLRAGNPDFVLGDVTTVTRPAGTVVRVTYRADSAPDAVTNKTVTLDVERYTFWNTGKLVTATLSAPRGSDNVDPWKKITESLAWQA